MFNFDPQEMVPRVTPRMRPRLAAFAFILSAGCALTSATAEAQSSQTPARPESTAGTLMRMPSLTFLDSVMRMARRQVGTRYSYGGERPGGFDCSGLVRYVMQAANVRLPRHSAEQARVGEAIPRDVRKLRVGDLLTFGDGGRVSHVGIYVGSGRFVHASSVSGRVVESLLERPSGRGVKPWLGARRLALQEPAPRPLP